MSATYIKWCNKQLKSAGGHIDTLTDLQDGVWLIVMLKALSAKEIPHYNRKAKLKVQCLDNLTIALDFMQLTENVKMVNITAISLYEAETALLRWIQQKIPECNITNFTTDWNDGVAICSLANALWPDVCQGPFTTEKGIVAADSRGVSALVDGEQMADPNVDKKSMLTYLVQFLHLPTSDVTNLETEVMVGTTTSFDIQLPAANKVNLLEVQIGCRCEGKAEIVTDPNDSKCCTVTYTPSKCGEMNVEIMYGGHPFMNSPYSVKVYGGHCHQCSEVIVEKPISYNDKKFHVKCYTCSSCDTSLLDQVAMYKDDALWCRECYCKQYHPKCQKCDTVIAENEFFFVREWGVDRNWHKRCFVCVECDAVVSQEFLTKDGNIYCDPDYYRLFGEPCEGCHEAIRDGERFCELDDGRRFHRDCIKCMVDEHVIDDEFKDVGNGEFYCYEHYRLKFGKKCVKCELVIGEGVGFRQLDDDRRVHKICFTCVGGNNHVIESGGYYVHEGNFYCESHYNERFGERCLKCEQLLPDGETFVQINDNKYHPDCIVCHVDQHVIDGPLKVNNEGQWFCEAHFAEYCCKRCVGCKQPIVEREYVILEIDGHSYNYHENCAERADAELQALE